MSPGSCTFASSCSLRRSSPTCARHRQAPHEDKPTHTHTNMRAPTRLLRDAQLEGLLALRLPHLQAYKRNTTPATARIAARPHRESDREAAQPEGGRGLLGWPREAPMLVDRTCARPKQTRAAKAPESSPPSHPAKRSRDDPQGKRSPHKQAAHLVRMARPSQASKSRRNGGNRRAILQAEDLKTGQARQNHPGSACAAEPPHRRHDDELQPSAVGRAPANTIRQQESSQSRPRALRLPSRHRKRNSPDEAHSCCYRGQKGATAICSVEVKLQAHKL